MMIRDIWRLWTSRCPTLAEEKYYRAMQMSSDLLRRIRGERIHDPALMVVSDVISHRNNVPYMTTVYEAVEEVNAPLKQARS